MFRSAFIYTHAHDPFTSSGVSTNQTPRGEVGTSDFTPITEFSARYFSVYIALWLISYIIQNALVIFVEFFSAIELLICGSLCLHVLTSQVSRSDSSHANTYLRKIKINLRTKAEVCISTYSTAVSYVTARQPDERSWTTSA